MTQKRMGLLAKLALFTAALIWGSSFVVMKNTLDSVPTFYLLAFRFTMAAAFVLLVFFRRRGALTADCFRSGAVLGVLLFLGYVTQTFGLAGSTPAKNAFLTTVYCVIVPFLYWLFLRHRPDRYNIIAAFLCVAGVGFVSLNGQLQIVFGDVLTLICGVLYAAHIVAMAKFSRGQDIFMLSFAQFVTAAVLAWVSAFIFEDFPVGLGAGAVGSLLFLGLCATGVALLLQSFGQKYSEPTTASILLALESVLGVLFSVLFYHEKLTGQMYVGFALLFAATICSETKLSFLRKKPAPPTEHSVEKSAETP